MVISANNARELTDQSKKETQMLLQADIDAYLKVADEIVVEAALAGRNSANLFFTGPNTTGTQDGVATKLKSLGYGVVFVTSLVGSNGITISW